VSAIISQGRYVPGVGMVKSCVKLTTEETEAWQRLFDTSTWSDPTHLLISPALQAKIGNNPR
jgi:hypothetical protein